MEILETKPRERLNCPSPNQQNPRPGKAWTGHPRDLICGRVTRATSPTGQCIQRSVGDYFSSMIGSTVMRSGSPAVTRVVLPRRSR
jgi:hypothetical protein